MVLRLHEVSFLAVHMRLNAKLMIQMGSQSRNVLFFFIIYLFFVTTHYVVFQYNNNSFNNHISQVMLFIVCSRETTESVLVPMEYILLIEFTVCSIII